MKSANEISDEELLKQLRQGKEIALQHLFHRYFKYLFSIAIQYIKDEHRAKDLIQDVFFELWKIRENLEIKVALKYYLRRAIINKCLNHIKSQRIQFEDPVAHTHIPSNYFGVQDKLDEEDLEKLIMETIDQLPERCRLIFILCRFEDLSHKEIAAQLGISTKTIENQMTKALKILREAVGPYLKIGFLIFLSFAF